MAKGAGKRPAEVFGYPIVDKSKRAQDARARHWCPFVGRACNKESRLIDYPFGVCSVEFHGDAYAVCPRRFQEQGTIEEVPRPLEDVARHYFGDFNNVVPFHEVKLPRIGTIDFVLVRHKSMKAEVDDFVTVEFQTDSTTGTGKLVEGLRDYVGGTNIQERTYAFNMNTYDSIKRAMTQLLSKGIVYEAWGIKGYWVIQEYIYANLVNRYGFKGEGYTPEHSSRFALYDLVLKDSRFTLTATRLISTTVDEVYQAMRNNRVLPNKDRFVNVLNTKLEARLSLKLG